MKSTLSTFALALGTSAAILFLTGCGPSAKQIREQHQWQTNLDARVFALELAVMDEKGNDRISKLEIQQAKNGTTADIALDEVKTLQENSQRFSIVTFSTQWHEHIFKIDRQTGDSFLFYTGSSNSLPMWLKIDDYEWVETSNSSAHGPWEDFRTNTPTKLDLRPVPDFDTLKPVTNSPSSTP